MFYSKNTTDLNFIFISVIYFQLIFVQVLKFRLRLILCLGVSNYFICQKNYPFFIELLLHHYQKSVGHTCVNPLLDSLFCSTDISVSPSTYISTVLTVKYIESLKIQQCDFSNLLFIFKIVLAGFSTFTLECPILGKYC